jgi:hypothetical protein
MRRGHLLNAQAQTRASFSIASCAPPERAYAHASAAAIGGRAFARHRDSCCAGMTGNSRLPQATRLSTAKCRSSIAFQAFEKLEALDPSLRWDDERERVFRRCRMQCPLYRVGCRRFRKERGANLGRASTNTPAGAVSPMATRLIVGRSPRLFVKGGRRVMRSPGYFAGSERLKSSAASINFWRSASSP